MLNIWDKHEHELPKRSEEQGEETKNQRKRTTGHLVSLWHGKGGYNGEKPLKKAKPIKDFPIENIETQRSAIHEDKELLTKTQKMQIYYDGYFLGKSILKYDDATKNITIGALRNYNLQHTIQGESKEERKKMYQYNIEFNDKEQFQETKGYWDALGINGEIIPGLGVYMIKKIIEHAKISGYTSVSVETGEEALGFHQKTRKKLQKEGIVKEFKTEEKHGLLYFHATI